MLCISLTVILTFIRVDLIAWRRLAVSSWNFTIYMLSDYILRQTIIHFNAVKCNLKELTTKSTRVPRSAVLCMRMPGGWLYRSCDSLARSVFSLRAGFCRPFSSPPALPLGLLGFFSTNAFVSVTGACSFPLVWGLMAGWRCCASHGGIISILGLAANSGSPCVTISVLVIHFRSSFITDIAMVTVQTMLSGFDL